MPIDLRSVGKSARRVATFLKKNPKTPSPEAIHKLRASARTLNTAFVAFELDAKGIKRLLRDLGAIQKAAGKIRDMDVLTANALSIGPSGEQDCLVRLLEDLGARRNRSAKKLRRLIRATRPQLRQDVKRAYRRAKKLLTQPKTGPAHDDAVIAATARAIRFSSELVRPGRLSKNNLHEYRLKLKRLRDMLRLYRRPESAALVKQLGKISDAIGDWHDWVELAAVAKPVLDHGASCKLPQRLKASRDAKYERALSMATGLTRRPLEPAVLVGIQDR